jgi:hypothetical protein
MTLHAIPGGKRDAPSSPRTEHARDRMQRWRMKHGDKLRLMHPDVALEVESSVYARIAGGTHSAMTPEDLRHCRMRVASRLRIKRYGPCTGDDEAGRQLRECLAELGDAGTESAA